MSGFYNFVEPWIFPETGLMVKTTALLVSLFLFKVSFAQNKPGTLLWEVQKKGNSHISYLFGTFHDVSPTFFDSLKNVNKKLRSSQVLFIEEKKETYLKPVFQNMILSNGKQKWLYSLTKEQDSILKAFVTKAEDSSYYKFPPLIFAINMSRMYMAYFCEADTITAELMDHHIEKIALEQSKKVYALDDEQALILNNKSQILNPIQDSIYILTGISYMKRMLNEDLSNCNTLKLYKKMNIEYSLSFDVTKEPLVSPLLLERNEKWVKILRQAFLRNNCFVAVGIRHLFYQQGLIRQLRKLGFTVKPIPS